MSGRLIGIAVRSARRRPMQLVERAQVTPEIGVEGDHKGAKLKSRQVTLLALEDWRAALADLDPANGPTDLEWTARRANLLTEGVVLPAASGAILAIGSVRIEVTKPVFPCTRMLEAHPDLMRALSPDWRGGVAGRVIAGGEIAVGDAVTIDRGRQAVDAAEASLSLTSRAAFTLRPMSPKLRANSFETGEDPCPLKPQTKRITSFDIRERKGGDAIVALTAYHAHTARIADPYVDFLLVGDSLGMVMHGYESTVPVPLELMIMHGRAVMRGAKHALVVVDMPFGTYEESPSIAFRNAARVMKETDCGAVKLEGGRRMGETIHYLVERGIPVMAHIGLTPQSINVLGGFKTQGRTKDQWAAIEEDARDRRGGRGLRRGAGSHRRAPCRPDHPSLPDPHHRHRRLGPVRRADPRHGGYAGPVAPGAQIRQGIRLGGREHSARHRGLCGRSEGPDFSGGRAQLRHEG